MKKLNFIFVLSAVVLFVTSCDVLNEEVVSDVTSETHFTTPKGLTDAVNATYERLRNFYGDEQGCNITEYGTDITTNAGHGGFHYMNQYTAGLNSEASPMSTIWDNFYIGINTCNAAIDRAASVEGMDEALKNSRIAEARFMRAFYYFTLVQYFGPVHLTLEETVGVETEATRAPEPEVYNAIITDLEFAIANLPDSQADYGRATKPAAEMLLSHVLLTRGYTDFAESDDFNRAATLAETVINDYGFVLLEDFEMIHHIDNQMNDEVIWAVQYTSDPLFNGEDPDGNPLGNRSHLYYRPWYETYSDGLNRSTEYGRPWIRFKPTPFALENFRPLDQDSRYNKSFQDTWFYNDAGTLPTDQYPNVAVGDTAIYIDSDMTIEEVDAAQGNTSYNLISWATIPINMFPSLKKHDDFQRPDVNEPAGSKDYIIYRLAEAHLFAAEAYYQAGNESSAVSHLNAVRERAAWPGQESAMTATTASLLANHGIDFILDERAREFYGEQKRWLTLKRTGKLIERVQAYNELGGPNIQDFHQLRPIPATQRNRTTNDYPQNPGY